MKYKKVHIPDFPSYMIDTDGVVYNKNGSVKSLTLNRYGYLKATLSVDGKRYYKAVHRLVLHAFKGFDLDDELVVHHINHKRDDNNVHNLDAIPQRLNVSLREKDKGLPVGVRLTYNKKNYTATIGIEGRSYSLGIFETPEDASNAYQYSLRKYLEDKKLGRRINPLEILW